MSGPKTLRDPVKESATKGWSLALPFGNARGAFDCWAQGLSVLTEEVAHFTQARLKEDMEAWANLTHCRNAGEAFECQSRYAQKTAGDYFDEIGKMSRLAMDVASGTFAALQPAKSEHAPETRAD